MQKARKLRPLQSPDFSVVVVVMQLVGSIHPSIQVHYAIIRRAAAHRSFPSNLTCASVFPLALGVPSIVTGGFIPAAPVSNQNAQTDPTIWRRIQQVEHWLLLCFACFSARADWKRTLLTLNDRTRGPAEPAPQNGVGYEFGACPPGTPSPLNQHSTGSRSTEENVM